MISTTLTQQMGSQPVARRRGAVPAAGVVSFCSAHRPASAHPYACIPASGIDRIGNRVLVSGFWAAGSMVAVTRTTKRPARPLARRKT